MQRVYRQRKGSSVPAHAAATKGKSPAAATEGRSPAGERRSPDTAARLCPPPRLSPVVLMHQKKQQ
ncbi:hypothetical protein TRIUR3_28470 [Triticum urartu]|uniref:Uncharacterized protein n=1 Tax=Triticum urartu TaxID=4572 RepID=M7ZFJ5_TRIUA|nr:hypothetical protein TRIUR3_28470 [Triticum urartu]